MSRKSKRWIRKGFYFRWSSTEVHWWIWLIHSTHVATRGPRCMSWQHRSRICCQKVHHPQIQWEVNCDCLCLCPVWIASQEIFGGMTCYSLYSGDWAYRKYPIANKWLIESIGLVWLCFLLAPRWCPGFPQLSRAYLWSGRRLAHIKVWTVCRQTCD